MSTEPGEFLVRRDSMSPEVAARMAAVIDPARRTEAGDPLPALWQWAYFAGTEGNEMLGPDGHLRREDGWAKRFPRRMAGGGRAHYLAPVVIGRPAEKRSRIERVEQKAGRSGDFVICEWAHTYAQGGTTVMEEAQTVIYRAAAVAVPARAPSSPRTPSPSRTPSPGGSATDTGTGTGARDAPPPPGGSSPVRRVWFDPVLLFRFSAATWNAHRIHYDRDYVKSEGYPGLLVHGPLLAILLAQEAERAIGVLTFIEFRSSAPVFDHDPVDIYLDRGQGRCRLEARKLDGTVASSLEARGGDE